MASFDIKNPNQLNSNNQSILGPVRRSTPLNGDDAVIYGGFKMLSILNSDDPDGGNVATINGPLTANTEQPINPGTAETYAPDEKTNQVYGQDDVIFCTVESNGAELSIMVIY